MKEPIRVLHVVSKMSFGGVQSVIMNYYRNIDRNNVQFDFVVQHSGEFEFDKEIKKLGGKIFVVPPVHKDIKGFSKYFYDILVNNKHYNTVHVHLNFLNIIPLFIAKKAKVKNRISHSHSNYKAKSKIKDIQRMVFRNIISYYASAFFACSKDAGIWLYGKRFLSSDKSYILNNAVDFNKFKYDEKVRNQIRKELNIENQHVFIHIGMFGEAKNHEYLIDIFENIYRKNSNTKLILIGDGEKKDIIRNIIKDKGLENVILLLGRKNNIAKYMSAADTLIFPSKNEGLPVVLVEAQINGLKCYASKEAVPLEIDISNSVEFISINKLPSYWSDRIVNCIDNNNERNLGKSIENCEYNIKFEAKKLQKYYEEIN